VPYLYKSDSACCGAPIAVLSFGPQLCSDCGKRSPGVVPEGTWKPADASEINEHSRCNEDVSLID